MGTRPVPVLHRLGVEGDDDAVLLGQTVQDVPGHPEVIGRGDTDGGTYLELPLGRHHLGVGARDGHAGEQATSAIEGRLVGFRRKV